METNIEERAQTFALVSCLIVCLFIWWWLGWVWALLFFLGAGIANADEELGLDFDTSEGGE